MNTATPAVKWTETHVHTAHGSGKVRTYRNVEVASAALIEGEGEGWVFLYRGLFGTETHRGYRTMREAQAAAVTYITSPIA